ncbi:MAG: NusG domain II-containing protein, partial [Treponema sp.]|nr:NusG domain II-containing protein [Treponema sp.]
PAYGGSGEVRAQVMGGGRSWVFPLAAAERLAVPGPLGETMVEIRDGRARIVSSPCMNQICVAAGAVHTPGQWTACLPNRVMVSISGSGREADGEVDAASW